MVNTSAFRLSKFYSIIVWNGGFLPLDKGNDLRMAQWYLYRLLAINNAGNQGLKIEITCSEKSIA
jgi:hypothetical protein